MKFFRDIIVPILFGLAVFALFQVTVGTFKVYGTSMLPGIEQGDYILVSKANYFFNEPQRGSIIVFHSPRDTNTDLIKRIIAVPGDTVEIKNNTVFVNDIPLVEPYTLGISGGAALGVSLYIVLGTNLFGGILSIPMSGFLGALLVIMIVYSLSTRKAVLKINGLLLIGVMISFISTSLITLFMALSSTEELHGIIFWIMGSLEEPNWLLIKAVVLVSFFGLVVSYFFCFRLNALSLGEEEAQHLGINTERTKRQLLILSSVLTGCSVAVAGIIGFVGLVVPHFIRMFVGQDHRILLISSFLSGAGFLILCDTLARTVISPLELPVGVVTGILGGSLFIYALTKKKVVL